jgi:hypothetical protein
VAVRHGYGKIAGADALVFAYDTGDTVNSFKGEPTVNYIPDTFGYSLYAYASGPVNTTVLNEKNKPVIAKRYTITNAVNTARAAIFPYGLTTGLAYTFSFKWKYNGTTTASPSVSVSAAKGYPEGGANNNSFTSQVGDTVSIGSGWYLTTYTFVFSSVPTEASILTFGISTGSTAGYIGETFDIYEAQFEVKDHRTQYSNSTRPSTQGLLDLTGNRTVELANVSFNSSAQPEFDGSNDLITFGGSANIVNKSYTIEAVFNRYSTNRVDGIIGDLQYHWFSFYVTSNNELYFFHRRSSPYTDNGAISATGVVGTGYYHAVGVFDNTSGMRVYLNGNLVASNSNTTAFDLSGRGPQYIGQHRGGAPGSPTVMSGQIPALKIYEGKALTAAEVRNNYRHYKTRFDIQ